MNNRDEIMKEIIKEVQSSKDPHHWISKKSISLSIVGDSIDQLASAALHERVAKIKNPNVYPITIIIPEDRLEYVDVYIEVVRDMIKELDLHLFATFVGFHVSLDVIRRIYEINPSMCFYYIFPDACKEQEDSKLNSVDITWYAYPSTIAMTSIVDDYKIEMHNILWRSTSLRRQIHIRTIMRVSALKEFNRDGVTISPFMMTLMKFKGARIAEEYSLGTIFDVSTIYAFTSVITDERFIDQVELRDIYDYAVLISNIVQDKLSLKPYDEYETGEERNFKDLYDKAKRFGKLTEFYNALSSVVNGTNDDNVRIPITSDVITWLNKQILETRKDD